MEHLQKFSKNTEKFIQPALRNPYFMAILKISLTLYASYIAPNPPAALKQVFANTYFKMLALAVILYTSRVDFQLSIILAVAFVITMNVLSGRSALESFATYSSKYTPEGTAKLIEPNVHIHPGCLNVTMDHLVTLFQGDTVKMQETVNQAYHQLFAKYKGSAKENLKKTATALGLPYNVNWDEPLTAPYIATLLINAGIIVSEPCQPPKDDAGDWKNVYVNTSA